MSPDTLSLQGKIAIVTGSGKENGIGAAIAIALARNGCAVAINHVSEASGPRAAEVEAKIRALGAKVVTIQADISTPEGAKQIVSKTLSAFGSPEIDILVNNAAAGAHGVSFEHFASSSGENIRCQCIRALIHDPASRSLYASRWPHHKHRLLCVSSKMGYVDDPIYVAMDQMTFALSMELGRKYGLTINTIAPGSVRTDNFPDNDDHPAVQAFINMTRAEGRPGNVEDIADAVLLLTAEKSRWLTGQYISASGGVTGG